MSSSGDRVRIEEHKVDGEWSHCLRTGRLGVGTVPVLQMRAVVEAGLPGGPRRFDS